jgi:phenylpropionate dioxygenase-like ring-hydroxylating dioxygenase large terminal subunit
MLTREENELLTRTGPDTPMGQLLRRFWVPVLLAEELPEPDCPPVRLRIMGEDLVAFKDTLGRIGVLDAYCPHRRAHLFWGRNEECGLRCVYHGWKFDVEGNCVDMPNEPPESRFKEKVKQTAYPAREWGGVIWAYMGPRELMPSEPPQLEWARVPASHRLITKRLQESNWAQAVEGGIDSSHVSFLHRTLGPARATPDRAGAVLPRQVADLMVRDTAPRFTAKQTEYGLLIGARRDAGDDSYYWRITQFLLPWYTMIPGALEPGQPLSGHAWVPIDDEHVWTFTVTWHPDRPLTEAELAEMRAGYGIHCEVDTQYVPIRNARNNYLIDRQAQKTQSYTGIKGISEQDMAVQESMGPIVDRTQEHLGTADTAIIAYRRLLLRLAKNLQQGQEPVAAHRPDTYRVRSASVILRREVAFDEGARERLLARV